MLLSPSPSPPSDASFPAFVSDPSDPSTMLSVHHPLLYSMPSSSQAHYGQQPHQSESPPPTGAKRYRSAPAKTFQCAGYGECRMVFSRSEHLARHIRKHTGERPFACHCTKQFSRLDNLRQHAQTVHSAPEDKPLNERMMRQLAGVNASMMAGVRGRRRYGADSPTSSSPATNSPSSASASPSSASFPPGAGVPPSFPPGSFASAFGGASPMASPSEYGAYDGSGSPLPSPGFGGFPRAHPGSPYSPYAQHAHAQGGSPYASPAALYEGAGGDYLSARAVRVKQEEREGEDALGLEGFYAALEGAASSSSQHHHQSHHGHHGLVSYASSSSLSSSSSASSSTSNRPDTARQGGGPRARAPPSSVGSSPAGSPCVGTFWAAGQLEQARAEQQLPSPPQSPPYYGEVIHSSHQHPGEQYAHGGDVHYAQQQHEQQQLYGWLADGTVSSVGEMSNGQYYAALQSPHHLHDAHSQQQQQQQQLQGGEYFAYQHGGVYA